MPSNKPLTKTVLWALEFQVLASSIFALSKGETNAQKIADAMSKIYEEMNLPYEIHVSKINPDGVSIIAPNPKREDTVLCKQKNKP